MGSSVAGQIRIDLIAEAAQFTAGIRGGKQELGSFREEFERLNRSFDSQKNIAARIGAEKDAWSSAMKGLRGDIASGGNSLLPWYGLDRMNARNNMAEDIWKTVHAKNQGILDSLTDKLDDQEQGEGYSERRKFQASADAEGRALADRIRNERQRKAEEDADRRMAIEGSQDPERRKPAHRP